MPVHLDSSAVLAALLDEPGAIDLPGLGSSLYASDLVSVEARRVLYRLRMDQQFDDEQLINRLVALANVERTLTLIEISRGVLARAAAAFPTHVRTLDAIHLATAALNASSRGDSEPVTFVTHDRPLAGAARALGYLVLGVEPA